VSGADPAAPTRRRRKRRPTSARRRWDSASISKRFLAVVAAASAVVGLTTGVIGLVRLFDKPPPPEKSGELSPLTAAPMSYREYIQRRGDSPSDFTEARLRCPVADLQTRVTTVGYLGKTLPVRWTVLTADGHALHTSRSTLRVTPTANKREFNLGFWAGLPVTGGRFTVLVTLLDENGQQELFRTSATVATRRDQFGTVPAAECPFE
jgi:hypothetical protein